MATTSSRPTGRLIWLCRKCRDKPTPEDAQWGEDSAAQQLERGPR